MTVEQAILKLALARKRQSKLRKEIDALRQLIREHGIDPDAPKIDLTERDKQFYKRWKKGEKFTQIAIGSGVVPGTVAKVCHRIQYLFDNKKPGAKKYAELAKYHKLGLKS